MNVNKCMAIVCLLYWDDPLWRTGGSRGGRNGVVLNGAAGSPPRVGILDSARFLSWTEFLIEGRTPRSWRPRGTCDAHTHQTPCAARVRWHRAVGGPDRAPGDRRMVFVIRLVDESAAHPGRGALPIRGGAGGCGSGGSSGLVDLGRGGAGCPAARANLANRGVCGDDPPRVV